MEFGFGSRHWLTTSAPRTMSLTTQVLKSIERQNDLLLPFF
jgi:hypothetical protein